VSLDTRSHHLICGPAGSGKTLLVLHRAKHLMNQGVSPGRLRALVYTKVLRQYIKSGTQALDVPDEIVQSFFQWVFGVARELGLRLPHAPSWDERFAKALETVSEHFETHRPGPILDVAIVDEGQDLTAEAYRLLTLAARHVMVFADDAQRLYENGVALGAASQLLGARRESANLLRNLRNSEAVSRVAAAFLPEAHRDAYRGAGHFVQAAGTVRIPAFFRAPSEGEEWDRLAAVVRREIERNARIGILLPTNRLVGATANRLRERGVTAETVVAWESESANFNELTPKVLTIHGAKGLSFDSILLPRLSTRAYGRMGQVTALIFVGVARALDWVYLSTTRGQELPELSALTPLIDARQLEELSTGPAPTPRPPTPADDLPL
jgi:superfamily I DNA/RNA helicase